MIPKCTSLLLIVAINVSARAGDGLRTHEEINRKVTANYALSAQLTMNKYIQQGLPVPLPIPFLPPHAAVAAQQHNARLTAQQQAATPPQQNTADAELQAQLQAAERLPDGCVLQ